MFGRRNAAKAAAARQQFWSDELWIEAERRLIADTAEALGNEQLATILRAEALGNEQLATILRAELATPEGQAWANTGW